LALVFDKIYFPGVWIPNKPIDTKAVKVEIERILGLMKTKRGRIHDNDNIQMLGLMNFIEPANALRNICIFTGKPGYAGILEEGTKELTMILEEMIYGPPPPDFMPVPSLGFAKGLPGENSAENSINAPSWLSYPANAVAFSQKNRIPLLNDWPEFPVPYIPHSPKNDARILSAYLALESVKCIFPRIGAVNPEQLVEIRNDLRDELIPFRIKMCQISKELNGAIDASSSWQDVQKNAKFIVETTIVPELENLNKAINDTGKPWHQRLVNVTLDTPELIGNFFTMLPHKAALEVFKRISQEVKEIYDEQVQKNRLMIGSGLSYLMKLHKY
jgi:hypothetical protein